MKNKLDLNRLKNHFPQYPKVTNNPSYIRKISRKKEFDELSSKVSEPMPKRGNYYLHQRYAARQAKIADRILFIDQFGTGKSCLIEHVKRTFQEAYLTDPEDPTRVNRAIILVKNNILKTVMRDEIYCKCTDGLYYTDAVNDALRPGKNNTYEKTVRAVNRAINASLRRWVDIMTYHSFYLLLKKHEKIGDLDQFMSNKVIFCDEIQNIYSLETIKGKSSSSEEEEDMEKEEETVDFNSETSSKSKSEKVGGITTKEQYELYRKSFLLGHRNRYYFFTATPMINNPVEFVYIMNLLLPEFQFNQEEAELLAEEIDKNRFYLKIPFPVLRRLAEKNPDGKPELVKLFKESWIEVLLFSSLPNALQRANVSSTDFPNYWLEEIKNFVQLDSAWEEWIRRQMNEIWSNLERRAETVAGKDEKKSLFLTWFELPMKAKRASLGFLIEGLIRLNFPSMEPFLSQPTLEEALREIPWWVVEMYQKKSNEFLIENLSDLTRFLKSIPGYIQAKTEEEFNQYEYVDLVRFLLGRCMFTRALDSGIRKNIMVNPTTAKLPVLKTFHTPIFMAEMSDFQYLAYAKWKESSKEGTPGYFQNEKKISSLVYPNGGYDQASRNRYMVLSNDKKQYDFRRDETGYGLELYKYYRDPVLINQLSCKFSIIIDECMRRYTYGPQAEPGGMVPDEKGIIFIYVPDYVYGSGAADLFNMFLARGYRALLQGQSIFTSYAGTNTYNPCAGSFRDSEQGERKAGIEPQPMIALLTGNTTEQESKNIFDILYSRENRFGSYLQVLISSRVGGEGISVNNCVCMFKYGPSWTPSREAQSDYRVMRSVSHEERRKFKFIYEKQKLVQEGKSELAQRIVDVPSLEREVQELAFQGRVEESIQLRERFTLKIDIFRLAAVRIVGKIPYYLSLNGKVPFNPIHANGSLLPIDTSDPAYATLVDYLKANLDYFGLAVGPPGSNRYIYPAALPEGVKFTNQPNKLLLDLLVNHQPQLMPQNEDFQKKVKLYSENRVLLEENLETTDVHIYRMSERKDLKFQRIIRIINQLTTNCYNNHRRNVRPEDKPGSVECNYQDCGYECSGASPEAMKDEPIDYTNKYLLYADKEKEIYIKACRGIFTNYSSLSFSQIFQLIREEVVAADVEHDENYLLLALEEIVSSSTLITNRLGFQNYLRESNAGIYYLDHDPYSFKRSSEDAFYNNRIFCTQSKRPTSFTDYIISLDQKNEDRIVDDVFSNYQKYRDEGNLRVIISQLSVIGKVKLIEKAYAHRSPLIQVISSIFSYAIFTLDDQIENIQDLESKNPVRTKGKKKAWNKEAVIVPLERQKLKFIPVKSNNKVILHTIMNEVNDSINYGSLARYMKGGLKVRIFREVELNSGFETGRNPESVWRTIVPTSIEFEVYNRMIQSKLAEARAYFERYPVHGIQIPPENRFQIYDGRFNEEASGKAVGKDCRTQNIYQLMEIAAYFGIQPPNPVRASIREAKNNVAGIGTIRLFPGKMRDDNYYIIINSWIQAYRANKELDLCEVLHQYMSHYKIIFKGNKSDFEFKTEVRKEEEEEEGED